jgi:hypothetical protein
MSRNTSARSGIRVVFCAFTSFAFLAGCNSGSTPTPTPPSVSVSLSPTTASLIGGGTQAFAVTVANDSSNSGVTWSIGSGAGALSASTATSVTYTAPSAVSATTTVTLTATSNTDKTKSTSATITLNPPSTPPAITSVAASCNPTSVQTGATTQCTATVTGTGSFSSAVTWSVSGVQSGNSTVGTISSAGLYSAPSAVPATNPVTVTATSTEDTTKSGSSSVTLTATSSSVTVDSISPMNAMPGALLTISGSSFDATASPMVVFTESGGFSLQVPPTAVTGTTITVTVPPFIDSATGAFGPGSYSISVNQTSGSQSVTSNQVAGFQVLALPVPLSPPGTLTIAFLQSTRDYIANTTAAGVQASTFNSSDLDVSLAAEVSALDTILPGLRYVLAHPSATYTIGTYYGQNVIITSASLAQTDQMLLGMLAAQAGANAPAAQTAISPYLDSGGGCQSAAAANIYNDVTTSATPNASQDVDAYYASLASSPCAPAQAVDTGLQYTVGMGAVAVAVMAVTLPADAVLAAVALPSAALVYVTLTASGGQIAVGGALGQAQAAGVQLVQNGLAQFEEFQKTLLLKGASLGVLGGLGVDDPDKWIGLAGGALAGNSVYNAFVGAPPYSGGGVSTPFMLTVTTSGAGSGTVLSYPGTIACGAAGGSCTANFPSASYVSLGATPAQGFIFTGWSGACAGTGNCSILMNADASVNAEFDVAPGTIFLGDYSAPFNGTFSDPNGGVYSATADMVFTLNLVLNKDGSVVGSADIPVNTNISLVSCPASDTCTPTSSSLTVTGPVTGSNGQISGNLSSGGDRPLTVVFTGVITGNSIAITGSFTKTFQGTSTSAPPTYTTVSGTISGLSLLQQ